MLLRLSAGRVQAHDKCPKPIRNWEEDNFGTLYVTYVTTFLESHPGQKSNLANSTLTLDKFDSISENISALSLSLIIFTSQNYSNDKNVSK